MSSGENMARSFNQDVGALAELLHETADHHGSYEAVAPPHDWWDWYAAYMDARRHGSTPEAAAASAGRYMAEVKHVVVPLRYGRLVLLSRSSLPSRGRGAGA